MTASSIVAALAGAQLVDVFPEQARSAPGSPVMLAVEVDGNSSGGDVVTAEVTQLGMEAGACKPVQLVRGRHTAHRMRCDVPDTDFQGYHVKVELKAPGGQLLGTRTTAIDVSSDWKRFPRYGYLSRFSAAAGTDSEAWIRNLARFHINGLQFYDFQYRHEQPLAGSRARPAATWKDIAGRRVEGAMVRRLIDAAHARSMVAMAYNASYSAYDDAFTGNNALPLRWASWDTADGPRSASTIKSFDLNLPGWSTSRLFYLNQNEPGWRRYIQSQMRDLFAVYPFDGWHIDTFGARGAFAFDGTPIDYIAGFQSYIDSAHQALDRRMIFNAVNTVGQESIAQSKADFVYAELWEDHETYASIATSTERVRLANPDKGYVLAAYVHRRTERDGPPPRATTFNTPSVLLLDATIFAHGASHIELGDGHRMLVAEYFPNERLSLSADLTARLRQYYSFATAYQSFLRGPDVKPWAVDVSVHGHRTSARGSPNTIWAVPRDVGENAFVHFINLTGSDEARWRDVAMTRPPAPIFKHLTVSIVMPRTPRTVGWASPDMNGGAHAPIAFRARRVADGVNVTFDLPSLEYWSMATFTF